MSREGWEGELEFSNLTSERNFDKMSIFNETEFSSVEFH